MVSGIDNPILVHRTSDYVRDNSALIKKTELMQETASKLSHTQFEQQTRFVADIETAREKTVNKDAQKKATYVRRLKKKKTDELDGLSVGSGETHRIDIEI